MSYPMNGPNVYAIYFRSAGVMKVGHSMGERWRSWVARGAELAATYEFEFIEDARAIERYIHESLDTYLPRAFANSGEAKALTGIAAGGWTEFYRLPAYLEPADILTALQNLHSRAITNGSEL